MPGVWVSVGSNVEREYHVRAALSALREQFGELTVSPVYETVAVGFEGNPFLNLVVGFECGQTPVALHDSLRVIEQENGRVRNGVKFGDRTLDLDLLTWGDQVSDNDGLHLPRDEIMKYAFVLKPLADVAGAEIHPETGQSYLALWAAFPEVRKRGLHLFALDTGLD